MEINWRQIIIASAISFVLGWVTGILSKGVREMLAPKILSHHKRIQVGKITESRSEDASFPFWYIPVYVNASSLWVLLASGIDDTEADVYFIDRQDNTIHPFKATWWRPIIDVSSETLRIGHSYKVRVVTIFGGALKPIGGTYNDYSLVGDYDIVIRLTSGRNVLGRWVYIRAIKQGITQEIEPNMIGNKIDLKTTFPTYNI